ncbi:MAG: histidine kinase, partial [Gaiellaceae bacterium]
MRWLRLVLWPAGLAAGIGALYPTLSTDGLDGLDVATVLYLFGGWSFIASGLVGWARRPENRIGALMVAIGFAWFASELLFQSNWSLVYTVGDVIGDSWIALLVLLLLAFPSGRLVSRLDRLLVAGFLIPLAPMEALWLMFLEFEEGEPENALLISPNAQVANAIDVAQRVILLAAVGGVVIVLARRWLRATAPLRRVLTPAVVGAAGVLLFGVVLLLDWIIGRERSLFDRYLVLVVIACIPLVFLVGLLRARLARSAVGDLLVELRETRAGGALRDALARALHDPSLALAYWVPEYDTYVGADGRPAELPKGDDGRVVTLVERRGRRVAALVHDASLRDEPELVGAVTAAAGIALENERLQADLRARLEELRGSRARIVEVGDSERRRLERNLHDGAQQRLVTLALSMRIALGQLDSNPPAARATLTAAA